MKNYELTYKLIEKMAAAAKAACEKLGVGVTLAIVDEGANLRYLQRFRNAILCSIEISQNKAYTAAATRMSTTDFGKIAQPGASAFGINTASPRLVIFGGGFPLRVGNTVIGGIGISGGSVEEDETVAHAVLAAFEKNV